MKKKFVGWFMTIIWLFALTFSLVGCNKEVDPVIICVEHVTEGQTLLSYMKEMQTREELSFDIQNGLINSINGTSNAGSSYWMLYTTDTDNANTAWGTYTYQDEILGSAIYGAEMLVVKNGEIYIWSYETM